ncbi:MAG: zinc-ribbon domain containing protein [Planctomycetaceae bacterium]|nr:zinc-ribbon domain containing protein [Planctomycetaceae bacterium]
MSDYFGEIDPRAMPHHLFWGSLHLDYNSAVKADISRQNFSVCPRYWYIDATFRCPRCSSNFCFSAEEQRRWYEELGFYVDSQAKHCDACRRDLRKLKERRQEYDRHIATALQSDDCAFKQRLVAVIDELCERGTDLPEKMHENRRILARQITRRSEPVA